MTPNIAASHSARPWWTRLGPPLLCVLALLCAELLIHPSLRMGYNDDFSYLWTAREFTRTGKIVYPGWGAMPLGWQVPWSLAFTKVFGFSTDILRASIFVLALITAALAQRTLVRLGLTEGNAVLAALTLLLGPLYLPLAWSYMSDVASLLCLLLCLYSCVRAIEASTDRATLGWLAFAALSNTALGTVRQIAWLGILVLFPCTLWILRRRRGALALGLGLFLPCVGIVFFALRWFSRQPYTVVEGLIPERIPPWRADLHGFATLCFSALPVLAAFLVQLRPPGRHLRRSLLFAAPLLALVVLLPLTSHQRAGWLAPFSEDSISAAGIDVPNTLTGTRPAVLSHGAQVGLTVFTLGALLATLLVLATPPLAAAELVANQDTLEPVEARTSQGNPRSSRTSSQSTYPELSGGLALDLPAARLPFGSLLVLLGPFALAYLGLIITREILFDRYWIPLLFLLSFALLYAYQRRFGRHTPWLGIAVLFLFAGFSIANVHDLFATYRARLDTARALEQAGVSPTALYAGLEFDGATELAEAGHLNNPHVRKPAGSFHPLAPSPFRPACVPWYRYMTPDLQPRYQLSYSPLPCFAESRFAPYPYHTWLAPRTREIYISAVPENPRGATAPK